MNTTHNLSGQQKANQNLDTFLSWLASKTDADFREMVARGQLNRTEIARECGFAKSVLLQNPRVKDALKDLETKLRERGILPPVADPAIPPPASEAPNPRASAEKARMKRLESENASLRALVMDQRKQMERCGIMKDVLSISGRLPR